MEKVNPGLSYVAKKKIYCSKYVVSVAAVL